MLKNSFEIILITESWLNQKILDSSILENTKYSLIRKDRINSKKGGGGFSYYFKFCSF